MTKEIVTLKESDVIRDRGCYNSTIVLRKIPKGDWVEYVTHMMVYPPDAKPYPVYGHYHTDLKVAELDYKERCKEYKVAEQAA